MNATTSGRLCCKIMRAMGPMAAQRGSSARRHASQIFYEISYVLLCTEGMHCAKGLACLRFGAGEAAGPAAHSARLRTANRGSRWHGEPLRPRIENCPCTRTPASLYSGRSDAKRKHRMQGQPLSNVAAFHFFDLLPQRCQFRFHFVSSQHQLRRQLLLVTACCGICPRLRSCMSV